MSLQNPRLLGTFELARHLAVRPETIARWARRGLIPSIRPEPGGRRYFILADVLAALRGRRPSSATGADDE
jgi:DNA-binding transcriptional MerR regulator